MNQENSAVESRPYMTRSEAASFLTERGLKISASRLAVIAMGPKGPPYRIFGRSAVYTAEDLLTWAKNRLYSPKS